jgi:ferrous iron transport protein A
MPFVNNKVPLDELAPGEHGTLLAFTDERQVTNRLTSLGFTPGAAVSMTQNYGRGPLIVTVRGTRVALGRGEAARILVQKVQA